VASILGTTAVALKLLGKTENQSQSYEMASDFWRTRIKQKIDVNS
jgi:hypothetical protein